jgi:transposase, IS5 family
MRPRQHETTGSGDLFRARLEQIINMKHELVQLAGKLDWEWIDGEIAPLYSDQGRPGVETRFVIGLLLLKHIYGLSDEGVCERWVHDPYFQYFTGEEFFQHEFPHERSDLSHWRKRLGDKLELLLAESLRVAHASGALRTKDLARVTVDTTVQPKAITFPTDAKLLHAAIKELNSVARRHGVRLRQSYLRIAKQAAMMAGRYAHAKQFNRHRRQLRILRTRLGRIIRDIHRKIAGQPALEEAFQWPLARAGQIRSQQQRQRGWKLYSFHAPEVECIGKGKASAPYEFGVKASIVTTNARAPGGQFVLHAKALPGNPYDGHTLRAAIEDTERLTGRECLCRQRIPRPRCTQPAPRLHLRPKARRVRRHQARVAPPLRHRARDRPHESRRTPRPLLSQGKRRRCRQRHPHRRRPQPTPRPCLAEDSFVPVPSRATRRPYNRSRNQIGFLTAD